MKASLSLLRSQEQIRPYMPRPNINQLHPHTTADQLAMVADQPAMLADEPAMAADQPAVAADEERQALIELYAKYLARKIPKPPYALEPDPLQEILHEAAKRAGWRPPSAKARQRQRLAARGRIRQRDEDLAIRRIFVSIFFKKLPRHLQQKPSSTATAQAIIGRFETLRFDRNLPMTVRTIQADITFMRKNGNFGIPKK
jgi:hypothetical protein